MERSKDGELQKNMQTNGLISAPAKPKNEFGKKTLLASGYTQGSSEGNSFLTR